MAMMKLFRIAAVTFKRYRYGACFVILGMALMEAGNQLVFKGDVEGAEVFISSRGDIQAQAGRIEKLRLGSNRFFPASTSGPARNEYFFTVYGTQRRLQVKVTAYRTVSNTVQYSYAIEDGAKA